MAALGKRPSSIYLNSGETLTVLSEAAQFSIPLFELKTPATEESPRLISRQIVPMGVRVTYSFSSGSKVPIPVLYTTKDSENSARPVWAHVLKDTVNPVIAYDKKTKVIHMFWWWNVWTPGPVPPPVFPPLPGTPPPPPVPPPPPGPPPPPPPDAPGALPRPPKDFYDSHSVPDLAAPAWLRSIVPKAQSVAFDPSQPFWVAPIAEGYQYDYWQSVAIKEGLTVGESRVNGDLRVPGTPGASLLQSLIDRGFITLPVPPEAGSASQSPPPPVSPPPPGPPPPSLESIRDDWERRGGIVAAGEYLRVASLFDAPQFIPTPAVNPYTNEMEEPNLPGVGDPFPESTTWEDFLVIVNALKAHYDHAYISNSTRVLMYASGFLLDGCILKTVPTQLVIPADDINKSGFQGPSWPKESEETDPTSVLVLNYPKLVACYPLIVNYRITINSDRVRYPYLDFPDIGTVFVTDGFLGDCATGNLDQHAALDWVISDPCEAMAQFFDVYRHHLDDRSY